MTTIGTQTVSDFLSAVAAKKSTPGGGAVAAVNAAEACALLAMVINFSKSDELKRRLPQIEESIHKFNELADADGAAFDRVMRAYKGDGDLNSALLAAANVPLEIMALCQLHLDDLAEIEILGNENLISDTGIAATLFEACVDACELNVLINAKSLPVEHAADLHSKLAEFETLKTNCREIYQRIRDKIR